MVRQLAVLAVAVALASSAPAQPPGGAPAPRFKWEAGKVLTYRVVQHTVVQETTLDDKTNMPVASAIKKDSIALVRKWTVKDVDKLGVATLEMSIAEMKQECREGEQVVRALDSTKAEDAKDLTFLNKPIVTVRIDPQGKLVEMKDVAGKAAARLQAELPFRLVLPDTAPSAGKTWDRPFTVKLDPPHGTGESYDFTQKYTSKGEKDGLLTVRVETALKAPPKLVNEQVPLAPMLWTGDVYFNVAAGKYHAARLNAKAELANHQGEGTKFVYESVYSEDAIEK
ncbi:hypothetical protein [Frigoriglobus tundricola]|uniref:Uncharacterized protein n=1 Tax=Frigoriglobus tundricola TaxID=2774151 RepID=A0A6M5YR94_9BACT|nr:hypothetical protein [Frigoriglobus tundricola]QJW95813.1 hypothetical protein FTUN_3367 [Frigoriglobus tundricola]